MDQENKIKEPLFNINSDTTIEEVDSSPLASRIMNRQNRYHITMDRFIRYCLMYDPLVDSKTGTTQTILMNPGVLPDYEFDNKKERHKQIFLLTHLMTIPSLTILKNQYIDAQNCSRNNYNDYLEKAGKQITYYSCLAPWRVLNPQEITEKYLNDYYLSKNQTKTLEKRMGIQKQENKDDNSNKESNVKKRPKLDWSGKRRLDKLETSEVWGYKQYICCEHEGQKGWIVLSRSSSLKLDDFYTNSLGIGENIVEADLNFQSKRVNLFLENMELNSNILDLNTPINLEQMKKMCQKYDQDIIIDSLKHKCLKSVEPNFGFELSCESEKYKFNVVVTFSSIQWTVKTDIEADYDIPIKATGKTLKEAFEKLVEKHERLSTDPKFIEEQVKRISQEEEKLDMQESYEEYRWLISEFGSDIVPD